MRRMSFDVTEENIEPLVLPDADLAPITEELSAAERAEVELDLHLVQPNPPNKFVNFFHGDE